MHSARQVRVTAIGVLTELLGPHHPPLTIEQVQVRVSDVTQGDRDARSAGR